MSEDFNWCHGPACHRKHTQDRIRGVKGSKVLRTRKISQINEYIKTQSGLCSVVKVVIPSSFINTGRTSYCNRAKVRGS